MWLRTLCLPGRLPRLGGDLWGFRQAPPIREFLRQGGETPMRGAAWRLKEAVKLGGKPSIDYVKTLVVRVNLPASIVKAAVELLERNRRVLADKNPWV